MFINPGSTLVPPIGSKGNLSLRGVVPQIAESYRVLTSNKEGKVICEIEGRVLACSLRCWWMLLCELDGRVLGGMQFEVLVDAALRD